MADIDFGQLSEALNDKSDRDLRNVDTTAKADAVIDFQLPTADNGYTWYRKYKSGWVEQGGYLTAQTINAGYSASQSLTFPITMQDINYCVSFGSVSYPVYQSATLADRTTTGGTAHQMNRAGSGSASVQFTWQVSGLSAN
jgi:hypothetical protein